MSRRVSAPIVVVLTLVVSVLGAVPAGADNVVTPAIRPRGLEIHLQPYVTVPDNSQGKAPRLNAMATAAGRLFVVEETDGHIYEISGPPSNPQRSLWFDVGAAIPAATGRNLDVTNTFHGGLRSVAFHPGFETNGYFYTSLMETRPANPAGHTYLSDVDDPIVADSVLVEWRANPATGVVAASSYREVFRVGLDSYDHPIKQIVFDQFAVPGDATYGLLHIGHGDGSVESDVVGGGQLNDALGKILRIDPRPSGGLPYRVPADNPFRGNASMLDEVYSIGHRNPHHLSFARSAGRSHLIVAEAGRDNVEEINIIEAGANYGWPLREGTFVHLADGGIIDGVAPLPANEASFGFTYPAAQVGHEGEPGESFVKQAIAGGYVVDNGSPLSGQYLYSDFPVTGELYHSAFDKMLDAVVELGPNEGPSRLTQAPTGLVTIRYDHDRNPATSALSRTSLVDVFNDAPTYETSRADVRFGQGPGGELYLTSKRNNTVYLVTSSLPGGPGGFNTARKTFTCSATARAGGFDITWENPPVGATRVVVDRQASDRFWWRGRATPAARTFRDPGALPPYTSRIDYRVRAKDAAGADIGSARCQLRNSVGMTCSINRSAAGNRVSWSGHQGGDVVIRRQVTDNGQFYWRGTDSSSPYVDGTSPGAVRYQVIPRNGARIITGSAACQSP